MLRRLETIACGDAQRTLFGTAPLRPRSRHTAAAPPAPARWSLRPSTWISKCSSPRLTCSARRRAPRVRFRALPGHADLAGFDRLLGQAPGLEETVAARCPGGHWATAKARSSAGTTRSLVEGTRVVGSLRQPLPPINVGTPADRSWRWLPTRHSGVGRPHLGIAQPVTCRTCGQRGADQGQRQPPLHLQSLMHCHIPQTGLVLVRLRDSITTPWPKRRLT